MGNLYDDIYLGAIAKDGLDLLVNVLVWKDLAGQVLGIHNDPICVHYYMSLCQKKMLSKRIYEKVNRALLKWSRGGVEYEAFILNFKHLYYLLTTSIYDFYFKKTRKRAIYISAAWSLPVKPHQQLMSEFCLLPFEWHLSILKWILQVLFPNFLSQSLFQWIY